jgi:hypothetical protein
LEGSVLAHRAFAAFRASAKPLSKTRRFPAVRDLANTYLRQISNAQNIVDDAISAKSALGFVRVLSICRRRNVSNDEDSQSAQKETAAVGNATGCRGRARKGGDSREPMMM